jgi:hypothetical protein
MREPRVWYNNEDSLAGEFIDAKARRIYSQGISRKRNGRTIAGKRLRLKGTAFVEIKAGPAPEYIIGDALSAENIVADADKIRVRGVTRGSSSHNIQQRGLRGDVFCIITRPLRPVREA